MVVDDGSRDETGSVVQHFATRLNVRWLQSEEQRGPAAARNRDAAAASGDVLAFLDDDCIPAADWISTLDDAFRRHAHDAVAVGGRTVVAQTNSLFGTASQLLVDFLYEWYNRARDRSTFFATNNFACRREHFMQLGGFDERFRWAAAEDRDFCDRWIERGWRLVFVPDAIVRHSQRTDLAGFLRQQSGYGRGAVDLHAARDRRGVARPRLESPTFYWRLLTYPLRREPLAHAIPLVALTAMSQAAYAWGYFAERLRRGRSVPRTMPNGDAPPSGAR